VPGLLFRLSQAELSLDEPVAASDAWPGAEARFAERRATTDLNGRVVFAGLAPGSWNVAFDSETYAPVRWANVTTEELRSVEGERVVRTCVVEPAFVAAADLRVEGALYRLWVRAGAIPMRSAGLAQRPRWRDFVEHRLARRTGAEVVLAATRDELEESVRRRGAPFTAIDIHTVDRKPKTIDVPMIEAKKFERASVIEVLFGEADGPRRPHGKLLTRVLGPGGEEMRGVRLLASTSMEGLPPYVDLESGREIDLPSGQYGIRAPRFSGLEQALEERDVVVHDGATTACDIAVSCALTPMVPRLVTPFDEPTTGFLSLIDPDGRRPVFCLSARGVTAWLPRGVSRLEASSYPFALAVDRVTIGSPVDGAPPALDLPLKFAE
jgi:hypothetical protein